MVYLQLIIITFKIIQNVSVLPTKLYIVKLNSYLSSICVHCKLQSSESYCSLTGMDCKVLKLPLTRDHRWKKRELGKERGFYPS